MVAKFKSISEERAWRCYVADSLQMVPQHKYFTNQYSERFATPKPVDNRTGDEIASDVINKLGLTIE